MRLQQWKSNGWLQTHQTTAAQIADLLAIVDRDLEDSMRDLSPDWQFGIAYNAALKLCTILLYASGYRPEKNLAHYRTLAALPIILGDDRKDDADYLDTCRAKRTPLNTIRQAASASPKPTNSGNSPSNSEPMSPLGSRQTIPH